MYVVLSPHTEGGQVIFGKNADRPSSEVQEVVSFPAKDHAAGDKLQCTFIEISQVPHTHAVILSKAAWGWGAEMGANEKGVCIGRSATWTKLNSSDDLTEKLLGSDLVRLGLERSGCAREAVDVIAGLLSGYGQGGRCSEDPGLANWAHHSSFLIADPTEAWVLETAAKHWAAQRITDGARHIANVLSIHTKIDLMSDGLIEAAEANGCYIEDGGKFDFAQSFSVEGRDHSDSSAESGVPLKGRQGDGQKVLDDIIGQGKFGLKQMCEVLREDEGLISISGTFISAASQISVLSPSVAQSPSCHWFTATPNPRISFFKPFIFVPGVEIGTNTVSPDLGSEDPAINMPRFQKEVDRRHPLYVLHEQFCGLLDRDNPKGHMILQNVHELEGKCLEDIEEVLKNYDEKSAFRVSQIFSHMTSIEMNFYK